MQTLPFFVPTKSKARSLNKAGEQLDLFSSESPQKSQQKPKSTEEPKVGTGNVTPLGSPAQKAVKYSKNGKRRAKKGGEYVNGKYFKGGQWIPNSDLVAAGEEPPTPQDTKKVGKKRKTKASDRAQSEKGGDYTQGYHGKTVKELQAIAKEYGIRGRSKLRKQGLIDAIKKHEEKNKLEVVTTKEKPLTEEGRIKRDAERFKQYQDKQEVASRSIQSQAEKEKQRWKEDGYDADKTFSVKWDKLQGQDVLKVEDSGSPFVAIPVSGKKTSKKWDIVNTESKELVTQLDKKDVANWLTRRARDLYIEQWEARSSSEEPSNVVNLSDYRQEQSEDNVSSLFDQRLRRGDLEGAIAQSKRDIEELEQLGEEWEDRIENSQSEVEAKVSEILGENDSLYSDLVKGQESREKANEKAIALLQENKAEYTAKEKKQLAKYSGYGGIRNTNASINEFYTRSDVSNFIWDILNQHGYEGGFVLEPSCGTGVMLHPAKSRDNTQVVGVEIDKTSSSIAQTLNPHAQINQQPLERFTLEHPPEQFDAVIGNVPFGPRMITSDLEAARHKPEYKRNEDLFVSDALDHAKAGGLVAMIVPHGVVSGSSHQKVREEIVQKGRVVGAYRLPESSFKHSGTSVVTDILVVQKHPSAIAARLGEDSVQAEISDPEFVGGAYFEKNPDHVVGEYQEKKQQFGKMGFTVKGNVNKEILSQLPRLSPHIDYAGITQDSHAHQTGETRIINGRTYRLNENHRWERVDEDEKQGLDRASQEPVSAESFGLNTTEEIDQHLIDPGLRVQIHPNNLEAYHDYAQTHHPDNLHLQRGIKGAIELSGQGKNEKEAQKLSHAMQLAHHVRSLQDTNELDPSDRAQAVEMLRFYSERFGNPNKDSQLKKLTRSHPELFALLGSFNEKGEVSDYFTDPDRLFKKDNIESHDDSSKAVDAAYRSFGDAVTIDQVKEHLKNEVEDNVLRSRLCSDDNVGYTNSTYQPINQLLRGNGYELIDDFERQMESLPEGDPKREKLQSQIAMVGDRLSTRAIEEMQIPLWMIRSWLPVEAVNGFLAAQEYPIVQMEDGVAKPINPNTGNPPAYLGDFAQDVFKHINHERINRGSKTPERKAAIAQFEKDFVEWLAGSEYRTQIEDIYNRIFNADLPQSYSGEPLDIDKVNPDITLHPYNAEGVRQMAEQGKGILAHDVGLGKAMRDGTPVLTKDGWCAIEQLEIGQMVANSSGGFSPVLGVYPQGEKDIYEVTFSDGSKTQCTDDHLWTVYEYGGIPENETPYTKTLHELKTETKRRYRIPLIQPSGETRDRALHFLQPFLEEYSEIDCDEYGGRQIIIERHIVEGLSSDFCTRIKNAVQALGGTFSFYTRKSNYNLQWQSFTFTRTYYAIVFPSEIAPFSDPYLLNEYESLEAHEPVRVIDSIRYVERDRATCIAVDAKDHLFIVNDFILTHNTPSALNLMLHLKQQGRARKPAIVAPKSVLANWIREAETWCPDAKIMVVGQTQQFWKDGSPAWQVPGHKFVLKDGTPVRDGENYILTDNNGDRVTLTPKQVRKQGNLYFKEDNQATKQQKLQQVKNNEYDIVLMSEPVFNGIPLQPDREFQYLDDIAGKHVNLEKKSEEKKYYKAKEQAEQFKGKLVSRRGEKKGEGIVYFEELGIDCLCGDEGHHYRNLFGAQRNQSVAYLSQAESNRSLDFYYKARHVRENNNNQNVYLLTATPTVNNPIEAFNMMQLIAPEELEKRGIETVDDFLDLYGDIQEVNVPGTDGKITRKNGLIGFKNLNDLRSLFNKYVRLRDAKDVGLEIPKEDADHVLVDMTAAQEETYEKLRERAIALQNKGGSASDEDEDHIFSVISDMDKAALDLSYYNETTATGDRAYIPEGEKSPKVQTCIDRILASRTSQNGKQIVFCDANQLHQQLKDQLVEAGYPEEEIAIVNGKTAKSSSARQKISNDFNEGKLSLVIGNTATMGEGMNFQQGTTDIHHLNTPWTPAAIQQRNGRGVRQGNKQDSVKIHYYHARKSFDQYRNATLQRKRGWINDLWKGDQDTAANQNTEAMTGDELTIALAADPEEARAKLAEQRQRQEEEQRERLKTKAISTFGQLQQMKRAYQRLPENARNSQKAQELAGKIDATKRQLAGDKNFQHNDLLEKDDSVFVTSNKDLIAPNSYVTGTYNDAVFKVTKVDHATKKVTVVPVVDPSRSSGAVYHPDSNSQEYPFKSFERMYQPSAIAPEDIGKTRAQAVSHYDDLQNLTTEEINQYRDTIHNALTSEKWRTVPYFDPNTGKAAIGQVQEMPEGGQVLFPNDAGFKEHLLNLYAEADLKGGYREVSKIGEYLRHTYGEKSNYGLRMNSDFQSDVGAKKEELVQQRQQATPDTVRLPYFSAIAEALHPHLSDSGMADLTNTLSEVIAEEASKTMNHPSEYKANDEIAQDDAVTVANSSAISSALNPIREKVGPQAYNQAKRSLISALINVTGKQKEEDSAIAPKNNTVEFKPEPAEKELAPARLEIASVIQKELKSLGQNPTSQEVKEEADWIHEKIKEAQNKYGEKWDKIKSTIIPKLITTAIRNAEDSRLYFSTGEKIAKAIADHPEYSSSSAIAPKDNTVEFKPETAETNQPKEIKVPDMSTTVRQLIRGLDDKAMLRHTGLPAQEKAETEFKLKRGLEEIYKEIKNSPEYQQQVEKNPDPQNKQIALIKLSFKALNDNRRNYPTLYKYWKENNKSVVTLEEDLAEHLKPEKESKPTSETGYAAKTELPNPNAQQLNSINYNKEKQGIEVKFDGKPEPHVLDFLKSHGFRWSRRQKVWYRKHNKDKEEKVLEFFGKSSL